MTAIHEFGDNYICIGPDIANDTENREDFVEDTVLFRNWKEKALQEGLRIRVGRWQIKGNPIAILVDFTPFFEKKNEIFEYFWLQNNLDSISGQWDYIEPALFGFAVGKVIESFYQFYCNAAECIIAHFHEWMTGTGVLYLENKVPQIATVFTTHATVLGRSIAGNGLPLYEKIEEYDPGEMARLYGVQAKHSLESIAALKADTFTTVSTITAKECNAFLKKEVDFITINGFENDFVPQGNLYNEKRQKAREKIQKVAGALLRQPVDKNALFVITSGRYEYRNKGIDLFIEGLAKLKDQNPEREIIAFIAVPAGTSGEPNPLIQKPDTLVESVAPADTYSTHPLEDPQHDPVTNGFKKYHLDNTPESRVKVVFVPVYLNGKDGVFDLSYYDFLIGFDLSVFPSYYEPWGYTPLESAAFGIPTVTTSLAGFGKWIADNFPRGKSVWVIDRNDQNDKEVSDGITETIRYYMDASVQDTRNHREQASEMAGHALWNKLFRDYLSAYDAALKKSSGRYELYKNKTSQITPQRSVEEKGKHKWKKITVKSNLPAPLDKLSSMAANLWWSWNFEARELFQTIIGSEEWKKGGENPYYLLQMLPLDRIETFSKDRGFVKKLESVYDKFTEYLNEPRVRTEKKIAYFSMEFGLTNEIKIYSGGLGILAGDYLKEASDAHVDMVGVGLLYRCGYFTQQISPSGDQINHFLRQSFSMLPLHPELDENGDWKKICISLPGRSLYARIWRIDVGRIPLYLLDSDIDGNWEEDRKITSSLYGGDIEIRLKQELLLGVGGARMLNSLEIKPEIFHLNEGHAAFLSLERLRLIMQEYNLPFQAAVELVKSSSLFTTHTSVPAGHDTFSEDLMRKYFSKYPERYAISWEEFMALGRNREYDLSEKFSMSILACKLSQEVNGVSKLHGKISREMFAGLYDSFFPEELHIGYVTNGVHYPTWAHPKWQEFHSSVFTKKFNEIDTDSDIWERIYETGSEELWRIKNKLRKELMEDVKAELKDQMQRRNESPSVIADILKAIRSDTLTVGFARRFATYKRAYLLFMNEERLSQLVNNPDYPITFLFAGKAHPHDKAGQDLIKKLWEFSRKPEFIGKIIFLENYDMNMSKKMVSGCDVWLNTPARPMEASGTSGEKAAMNGVLNFSILDGWWLEGYDEDAGWAISDKVVYEDSHLQDELDATTIYHYFEEKIAPAFYQRNMQNVPEGWVEMMKNNFVRIAPNYTMKRQLHDYYEKYYHPLEERITMLKENNMEKIFQLIRWKNRILTSWENIEVAGIKMPDIAQNIHFLGENLHFEVKLNLGNIRPEEVKMEILFADKENGKDHFLVKLPFEFSDTKNGTATFICNLKAEYVGVWNWAIRLIPVHPLIKYGMDFNLVKWI